MDNGMSDNWMRPLVQAWKEKRKQAEKVRKNWLEVAGECRRFYAGPTSWMWDKDYRGKLWGGDAPTPTFKLTVNKAFEFVSIYLPYLWSNLPHRQVDPKRQLDIDPVLLFGPPPELPPQVQQAIQNQQADPQIQMIVQQHQMAKQQYDMQVGQMQKYHALEKSEDKATADLMKRWLNYTIHETPDGGLNRHGRMQCLDALITGRGVLWSTPYSQPGSDRKLVGSFWRPVTDFYTDPDFETWQNGGYVMRDTTEHVDVAERRFRLPPGTLRHAATFESFGSYAERSTDTRSRDDRNRGKTKDKITYTEVWSKSGVGAQWTSIDEKYRTYLEKVTGRYAYVAFCKDVPWLLNAPPEVFRRESTDDEIKQLFSWPTPFFADSRWPCSVLDFHSDIPLEEQGSDKEDRTKFHGWPIAPMGPGLGELKFVNAAMSFLTNRIVTSCRDFWAVLGPAYKELVNALESGKDQSIIKVNRIHGDIKNVLQIIQQPETRKDVWNIIDAVLHMLDKRWHLNSLMYGMSGPTQERSATEVVEKRQAMQLVPEYMAKLTEDAHTDVAMNEAICTVVHVKSSDVEPLFGKYGAALWKKLIEDRDPEIVLRQMQYTITAGTIRRPNRDRDAANFNSMMQAYGQLFQSYFQSTGDPEAINETIRQFGEINERDMSGVFMKPPQPPQPDPMEQQRMQLEMQKLQAELQLAQMDIQGKQADQQSKAEQARMKIVMDQQSSRMKLGQDRAGFLQDLQQDQLEHGQEMRQGAAKAALELDILKEKSDAQVAATRAQARASGNGKKEK